MAQGNGHSPDGMTESVFEDFTIGKTVIRVPELMLWDLDQVREHMLALDGTMWWADYAMTICKIISILKPDVGSPVDLYKKCSVPEARALSPSWTSLLLKSGFEPVGEVLAAVEANPGTGTLTPSSPNSQSEESVEATQSGSNEPLA